MNKKEGTYDENRQIQIVCERKSLGFVHASWRNAGDGRSFKSDDAEG
jgi:hypothetical protein